MENMGLMGATIANYITLYPLLFFQCSAWCFGTDRPIKTAESIVKT